MAPGYVMNQQPEYDISYIRERHTKEQYGMPLMHSYNYLIYMTGYDYDRPQA